MGWALSAMRDKNVDVPGDKDKPYDTGKIDKKASRLDPELTTTETKHGTRPGDIYVRVKRPRIFRRVGPGYFVATPESDIPQGRIQRGYRRLKRVLIGRPLFTSEEVHQRLGKVKALAIFGSDAISSSAYATEASLAILVVAGNAALGISFYTALAVALLLSMVAFSYRQTVHAYPQGGGAYNVSRENLGRFPSLVAAAALLVDYVLTVSVSIVAGTRALISALIASGYGAQIDAINNALPLNLNLTVILSLFFISLITLANLRGVRESGTIFAIPTYLFIISISLMLVVGLFKAFTSTLQSVAPPPLLPATEPLTLWLVLRAFSAGAVAMSGTEAISNGVPVFRPPESKNAAKTLTIMATLLGVFFLGVSYLATHMKLAPGDETIISQIALAVFGRNILYYVFQIGTIFILVVAANTAFTDFPRLSSVLARDNYMPRQFQYRGDRLAFSTGIIALGLIAAILVVVFSGNVESLINLYAIGVFLAFSMSDSGMVVHWWKTRGPRWKTSIAINGIDAVLTSSILVIAAMTKFTMGGWIVVFLVPIIIIILWLIHRHYSRVAEQLRIVPGQLPPHRIEQLVVVLIDDVNYASLRAMSFVRTISAETVVMHVSTNIENAEKIRQKMQKYAPDLKLVIIESPTRALMQLMLAYVDAVHSQSPSAFVTIVLPEFITAHWWERFLHNRIAERLRREFEKHPNVTVVLVPYLLEK
jgi:amino acid transporter